MNIKYTLIAEVDDQEVAVLTAPTTEMIQEQLGKAEHAVDRFIEENYLDECDKLYEMEREMFPLRFRDDR